MENHSKIAANPLVSCWTPTHPLAGIRYVNPSACSRELMRDERTHLRPTTQVATRNLYANIPDEFSPLLTTDDLTLDRVAKWLPLHETLDDLDWAVAEPPTGPIQTSLLARASVAEGVHRRLLPESRRFDLSKGALKNIREELRDRGTELFRQHGIDDKTRTDKCISDALNYMNDISFRDRVDEMVAAVNNVAPIVLAANAIRGESLQADMNYATSHDDSVFMKSPIGNNVLLFVTGAVFAPRDARVAAARRFCEPSKEHRRQRRRPDNPPLEGAR
jgi:hypothetical protein